MIAACLVFILLKSLSVVTVGTVSYILLSLASKMKFLSTVFGGLLAAQAVHAVNTNAINAFKRHENVAPIIEKRVADQPFHNARLQKRASPYLNNVTEKFVVNGSAIPDVDFDVGESYAGLLPISGAANETRELFFWFFPSSNPLAADEIAIW